MFQLTNSTPGQFVFFLMLPDGSMQQLTIPGNNIPIEITAAQADALRSDMVFNWYYHFGIFTLTPIEPPPEP